MTIHVDIVSAESEIFSGKAEMVFAPAVLGEVGIAPGHTPLLTQLGPGEVRLQFEDGSEEGFYVSGGVLEVQPKVVTILSDTAERAEDLDEVAILKAKEVAEVALQNQEGSIDYALARSELAETVAQIQTIQRLRRRAGSGRG
jgi:F-type H+-transporting ATPase subunit epsilon|tara:strand:- start:209 stop:637 length:429 start_codon:yes stop_codon:yes gene_type:complete